MGLNRTDDLATFIAEAENKKNALKLTCSLAVDPKQYPDNLDPKIYSGTCAIKSFFISLRAPPSVVTAVFLYALPAPCKEKPDFTTQTVCFEK